MSGRTVGKGSTQGSPTQRSLPPQTEKLKLDRAGGGGGWGGEWEDTYDPSQGSTRLYCLNGNEKDNFLFL